MAAWAVNAGQPARPRLYAAALAGFAALGLAQFLWIIVPHDLDKADQPNTYTEHNRGMVFTGYSQYDYHKLADHSELGWAKTAPNIAMIGGGGSFNRQQVASAWNYRGDQVSIDGIFDGYGKDTFDGPAVLDAAAKYDAVLISPDYQGLAINRDGSATRFNASLIDLLNSDPRFETPVKLTIEDANDVEPDFTCLVYRVAKPGDLK
jgi:hypothetical protein